MMKKTQTTLIISFLLPLCYFSLPLTGQKTPAVAINNNLPFFGLPTPNHPGKQPTIISSPYSTTYSPNILIIGFLTTPPSNATHVDPRLLSLSIEQCFFLDWAGTVQLPNSFSQNLIYNIKNISGYAPAIRVGGNTEDHTFFNDSIDTIVNVIPPATEIRPAQEANISNIGRGFYEAIKNFNTTFTLGLNFLSNNYSEALTQLTVGYEILKGHGLEFIELGNEIDLYPTSFHYPWNANDYAKQWSNWTKQLNIDKPFGKMLQLGALANPPNGAHYLSKTDPWTASQIILDHVDITNIAVFSGHLYAQSACSKSYISQLSLSRLLSHSDITTRLNQYKLDIAAVHAANMTFMIGEGNTVVCHGADGISNTFASAIWAIDHALYGATLGIERFYMHNGRGFFYNVWYPNGNLQYAAPLYYAYIFMAYAISGLNTFIASLSIIPSSNDNIVLYGMYEFNQLKRVVVINSLLWKTSMKISRSLVKFSFPGKKGTLHRLTAPEGDSKYGISYAGQTYSNMTGLAEGLMNVEKWDGSFILQASEACILFLE